MVSIMKKSEALNILGLQDGASDDEVKAAHRQKIRENHPDKFTDPERKRSAEDATKRINEARDVLISRKWDPEYGPRAGYAGTYQHPYGGSQGTAQNPFAGQPFTYVWTSWDDIGTNRGGTQGANPYDFVDFASVFTQRPAKTPAEEAAEAKENLKRSSILVAVKAGILGLCAALGGVATGMFVYIIATILFAVSREVRGCSSILLIPFIIFFGPLIMLLMPGLGASIGMGLIVFFGIAVAYDIGTLRRLIDAWRTTKEKAKVAQ